MSSPSALISALAVVVALAGCGHVAPRFPANPTRLVTDDELSTDVMLSLGFKPVGAVGMTATAWPPALAPYLRGAENLGGRAGGSANLDAIAGARPDAILGPISLVRQGWGSQLSATAPTAYYAPGGPGSSWTAAVRAVAAPLGLTTRANRVIAALELRAAAIRAQVKGKTVALLRIAAPQSFTTVDDFDPAMSVLEQDLGLRNAELRPHQYGNRCAPRPSPPRACRTNELFVAVATMIPHLDALLLETGTVSPAAAAAFQHEAYYRQLAAVRAGRVAPAATYEEVGPLGVAYLYSAVERAFGLVELHGVVRGKTVEATYDHAAHRLCWAGLLAGSSRPPSGCAQVSAAPTSLDKVRLQQGTSEPIAG
jgi:ABC-type Fe3+-hydroxamate transport system substrate-binding protein